MSTTQSPTAVRWIADSPDSLLWAKMGEDYVAYHRPSGTTHLLNDASRRLLRETLTRPLDLESIVRQTVDPQDGAGVKPYVAEMKALLDHLERLGLVGRV